MVRQRYVGVIGADTIFDVELRPFVEKLRRMQAHCRPMGDDYLALANVLHAMQEAAVHFTGRTDMYSARNSVEPARPPGS